MINAYDIDLAQIRADIAEMSDTDLAAAVFYPKDEDGEARYSRLDILTVEEYQQGRYVNTYRTKAQLTALFD